MTEVIDCKEMTDFHHYCDKCAARFPTSELLHEHFPKTDITIEELKKVIELQIERTELVYHGKPDEQARGWIYGWEGVLRVIKVHKK